MRKVYNLLFAVALFVCCIGIYTATCATTPHSPVIGGDDNTQISQVQEGLLLDVTTAGKRLIAVGERGHIIYSDDNGVKWELATVPVNCLLTAVSFPTELKGWAVGHDGIILHSEDGGKIWSKQLDGVLVDKLAITSARERLEAFKIGMESAGEEVRESMERELEELEYQLERSMGASKEGGWKPFLDVLFLDEENGIAAGAFGIIFGTHDGGATWEPWMDRMPNPFGYHYYGIAHNGHALLIAGEAGTLYRSMNKGTTWNIIDSPYEGSFFGILATDNSDDKKSLTIVYGMRGTVFVSTDLGDSWRALQTGVDDSLGGATILREEEIRMCTFSGKMIRGKIDEKFDVSGTGSLGCSGIIGGDGNSVITIGLNGVQHINSGTQKDRK